jgi:threonine dehydrogenase-like Zn-dependent dehydrogenase
MWNDDFRALRATYKLILLDALGFGRSPKPDIEYTVTDHLAAIHQTLQSLNVQTAHAVHRAASWQHGSLAQAEYARIPLADGTLVATPDMPSTDLIPSLLAASDVLGAGWFGAVAAETGPGKTVAVVGDGAVGLLAVLAAKQLGAERIIAMSRHESRQKLAREFGATDIVTERGDAGVARIKDMTGELGAHSVVEAVGTQESMMQAIR